ncbi:MAG: hypothetical protein HZB29_10250 [Nitrospinae bacterium]|nr:hypothetical protein [Nitrospinota bacterium]
MIRASWLAVMALVLSSGVSGAFYKSESDDGNVEGRILFHQSVFISSNPGLPFIYPHSTDNGTDISARLMLEGTYREFLKLDFHAEQRLVSTTVPQTAGAASYGVMRSPALYLTERNDGGSRAFLDVDRINLRATAGPVDVIAGRQPISMATCYYFTPNDFFAPFAASTFYRLYKPGVDAVRVEARLGDLTQFTAASALGYEKKPADPSGYGDGVDWGESSYVARLTTSAAGLEIGALAGRAHGDVVTGGSFQGEIGKLGIRGEGHYVHPEDGAPGAAKIAVQLERKYENSLTLRAEYYHNGAGATAAEDYQAGQYYPARDYAAIGAGYEFTPLLTGEMVTVINLDDGSYAPYLYFLYSLADEMEMALGFSSPRGDPPSVTGAQSQYGGAPSTFTVEIRAYF